MVIPWLRAVEASSIAHKRVAIFSAAQMRDFSKSGPRAKLERIHGDRGDLKFALDSTSARDECEKAIRRPHNTHNLLLRGNMVFGSLCGNWAVHVAHGLLHPCARSLSSDFHRQALTCLGRHLHPSPIKIVEVVALDVEDDQGMFL
jgi:hypothetical protein